MIIRSTDGWSYTLTPADKLWLAIAAEYEGGADPADVWWTYAQRLALPAFRSQTMQQLVAGHSQPVNPKWRRDGQFCRTGGEYAGSSHCSEDKLRRRDEAKVKLATGWSAVDPQIARRFVDWENGRIGKRVGKAVDFADPAVSAGFLERNPGSVVTLRAGNWFIATPTSLARDGIEIGAGGSSGGLGGLVLLGLAGWAAWRYGGRWAGLRGLEGPRGKPPTEDQIKAFWAKQRAPEPAALPPPTKTRASWQKRGRPPTPAEVDEFWASMRRREAVKEKTVEEDIDPEEMHYRKARHL